MTKPHVTVFSDAGQPFLAMHINGYLCGLWTGAIFQCAGEVLKALVDEEVATLGVIGEPGQKAWDEIKTAKEVLRELSKVKYSVAEAAKKMLKDND